MGAREDEAEEKQEAVPLCWQDSGPRNSHLLVLLQRLWPDSVSGASSVCLRVQTMDVLEGLEAVAQPWAAAPSTSAPPAVAACTAASLLGAQRCPPTCSESLAATQFLQDGEVIKKSFNYWPQTFAVFLPWSN